MRTYLTGGKIITPEVVLLGKTLIIEEDQILGIVSAEFSPAVGEQVIDAAGGWIAPGMIDLHVHGAVGFDTMDATTEASFEMGQFFAKHGVTSFLATTMSAPPHEITRAIQNVAGWQNLEGSSRCLGIHIEGPYLNPTFRGAQPERYLRDADPVEYKDWITSGVIRLVSIAPERPGSLSFITQGVNQGVEFAVGHSGATYEQVIQAADCGLRQATHTFNGMLGLHHREPGVLGAVLSDSRIFAQIIADSVHVHPAAIRILVRAKGADRTILITDAIQAAGLKDGEYELGKEKVVVHNGISRTISGGLAGSTLTMDGAVRNMIAFTGLSFEDVIPMATSTPAAAMGWYGKKGIIRPGADADIVVFDQALQVRTTLVGGKVVYQRAD